MLTTVIPAFDCEILGGATGKQPMYASDYHQVQSMSGLVEGTRLNITKHRYLVMILVHRNITNNNDFHD